MKLCVALLVLCLGLASAEPAYKSYSGYKVLRVQSETEGHAEFLHKLEMSGLYDFWTDVRIGGKVDIMAEPSKVRQLERLLNARGLSFSTMVDDLGPRVAADQERMKEVQRKRAESKADHTMDWVDYHTLDEIYEYFDYLETTYPDVSQEVIGQSYEGREMRVIKLCSGGTCGGKPTMFIDGGIHSREWISPATSTYMLNELTENLDPSNQDLVDDVDWYFVASVNPDGYAYTQSSDRLWRKTRSSYPDNTCVGTDANRNFGSHFDEGGASDNSCTETYHGPEAFSEIETQNIRDFMMANKEHIRFYNNLHSYSQLIMYAFGYTCDELPEEADDIDALASEGNDALYAVHQKNYEFGPICTTIYQASGNSVDFANLEAGIKYSYTIELRDTGLYGFQLPPEEIIPNGEEIFAFHASAARRVAAEFGQEFEQKRGQA